MVELFRMTNLLLFLHTLFLHCVQCRGKPVPPEDWTLRIAPVLLEDDALFQCQVGAANGIKPVR
jgi:hypothetical protein